MSESNLEPSPLTRLAVPGERFGWIFRDRNLFRRRFTEPQPEPIPVPFGLVDAARNAKQRMTTRIIIASSVTGGAVVLMGCCGSATDSAVFGVFAVLALLAGAGAIALIVVAANQAAGALQRKTDELRAAYQQAYGQWDARRQTHEHGQQQLIGGLLEWGAATPSPGTRRVDIFGGTSWGWEALLTVFGGSLLSTHGSMVVVDFSGETLCAELTDLARQTGSSVDMRHIPSQLAEVDLLAGLGKQQLIDSLVEAMHGDATTGSRADRVQDSMLLHEICEELGGTVTIGRIIGGLRVLTDRSGTPALTLEEADRIRDSMPDETRRQLHGNVRRIEAFLRPLEAMGTAVPMAKPATVTVLATDRDGRSAQNELLKDLVVQWLTRWVGMGQTKIGSLIVIGADEIDHRHIEKLGTICERQGTRLVTMFEHLREASLHAIGGGEVAFMRLANHDEARQAAEFIGKQHKFVLSQLTRTLGGNETHSVADTEGESTSESRTDGYTSGRNQYSRSRSRSWTKTVNWSQTVTNAEGTTWSDAASAQRVYEYTVEPRVLQDLPDYAMLLVKSHDRGSTLQAVECDPAIVTLPRLSMQPLPPMALPQQHEAVNPVSGLPNEATISRPVGITPPPMSPGAAAANTVPGWGGAPGQSGRYPQQGPGWRG
ncbi:hypothetical protein ACFO1B_21240 [Dactylosporangium siamense]|uniref:Uncharacterized protein n=1 Tax=Dactylosporangium siamense TaxID=685454 RepID=A0A919UCL7_9ACTN|nr:hypothetical protein [Dactylosporangium siamense]GIG46735.1 hypothetical protein Dsi01nite_047760 [Dactylosporangium siamense]